MSDTDGVRVHRIFYFVDMENTGPMWQGAVSDAVKGDAVFFFWTRNASRIDMQGLSMLQDAGCAIQFRECCTGDDGLDFQLCSELGFQAAAKSADEYCIISNDQGYDVLRKYWSRAGIRVSRRQVRAQQVQKPPVSKFDAARKAQSLKDRRAAVISRWSAAIEPVLTAAGCSDRLAVLLDAMKDSAKLGKKKRMMGVYTYVIRVLGKDEGLCVYKAGKPEVSKIMAEPEPYPLR